MGHYFCHLWEVTHPLTSLASTVTLHGVLDHATYVLFSTRTCGPALYYVLLRNINSSKKKKKNL